jgi:hypothetical protein
MLVLVDRDSRAKASAAGDGTGCVMRSSANCERQRHRKRAAPPQAGALCHDADAMQLDQLLHDREPNPEPALRAFESGIRLCEYLEDTRQHAAVLDEAYADPGDPALDQIGCTVLRNGQPAGDGSSSDVLQSPLHAVAWLADTLGALGTDLAAGCVVLSGALTPPGACRSRR